ncbi:MAG: peptidyl-prolyl cis-trans isomerase [Bdellovibrionaceae bacterium]|nr:peptidyl-prolyl cis-trans isomerase [Pseudobdellovibrionaceae bacterium]
MKIRHILVEQRYEAEDILRLLQQGQSFETLAQKFSQCSSAGSGGDLSDIPLGRLDESFREAAELLKVGEISPIVRTRFGYHLIQRF